MCSRLNVRCAVISRISLMQERNAYMRKASLLPHFGVQGGKTPSKQGGGGRGWGKGDHKFSNNISFENFHKFKNISPLFLVKLKITFFLF